MASAYVSVAVRFAEPHVAAEMFEVKQDGSDSHSGKIEITVTGGFCVQRASFSYSFSWRFTRFSWDVCGFSLRANAWIYQLR